VLRDLFRKSGRPLERSVELVHREVARRHVFADGSVVDLPTGSRGDQIDAVDAGLGHGTGTQWAGFVDAQSPVWSVLRQQVFDDPLGGRRLTDRAIARQLRSSTSLEKLLKKSFDDDRLRQMVTQPFETMGSHPRDIPSYAAVQTYVERSFGVWGVAGGMATLADALVARLAERGVELRCDCPVASIDVAEDRVRGVQLVDGEELAADVVITDVDPRVVFAHMLPKGVADEPARLFAAATPALPPEVTHLGVSGPARDLPDEVVLHGDPLMVILGGGSAPAGGQAWTVLRRGSASEDVLLSLARRGIEISERVVTRVDRSPADVVAETCGSPYGLAYDGWRATGRRAAHTNPLAGLYLLGASIHPGASIPYVAWGAAHAAQLVDAGWPTATRT
jgi:UDP-galactopyranose mutase